MTDVEPIQVGDGFEVTLPVVVIEEWKRTLKGVMSRYGKSLLAGQLESHTMVELQAVHRRLQSDAGEATVATAQFASSLDRISKLVAFGK